MFTLLSLSYSNLTCQIPFGGAQLSDLEFSFSNNKYSLEFGLVSRKIMMPAPNTWCILLEFIKIFLNKEIFSYLLLKLKKNLKKGVKLTLKGYSFKDDKALVFF